MSIPRLAVAFHRPLFGFGEPGNDGIPTLAERPRNTGGVHAAETEPPHLACGSCRNDRHCPVAAADAFAASLPKDTIKRIRYYITPTDAAGRANVHQPTFNQSTNIVIIETTGGLIGIGEGGDRTPWNNAPGC